MPDITLRNCTGTITEESGRTIVQFERPLNEDSPDYPYSINLYYTYTPGTDTAATLTFAARDSRNMIAGIAADTFFPIGDVGSGGLLALYTYVLPASAHSFAVPVPTPKNRTCDAFQVIFTPDGSGTIEIFFAGN